MRVRLSLLTLSFVVSGCQCNINDDNFDQLKDAGFDEPDAGPPPPVFPLKEGDELEYQIGGRIPACPNGAVAGDCERNIKATYVVSDTKFEGGRWTVEADFFYEGTKEQIEAVAIAQLVLENVAPFDQVSIATPVTSSESGPADFRTDRAATHELNALGFPFFQYEDGDAGIFEAAGEDFCGYWREQDPDADCDFLTGDYRMQAVFVDPLAESKLHQLRVEYHPMGFICGWIEELGDFGADPDRSESVFNGVNGDPEAFFFTPRLRRDGASYSCNCFSQVCKDVDDPTKCLDPADPDAIVTCP